MDDQVLRSVVLASAEVAIQDGLGPRSVSLLGVDRGTGHVGDHGVSATEGVLGGTERMVSRCGLREPDITSVAAEVA